MRFRAGEGPRVWPRRDRISQRDGQWWFVTRERVNIGPYETRFDAEIGSRKLARVLRKIRNPAAAELAVRRFQLALQGVDEPAP
jgi:hypothetical protein